MLYIQPDGDLDTQTRKQTEASMMTSNILVLGFNPAKRRLPQRWVIG